MREDALAQRVAELEAALTSTSDALASTNDALAKMTAERDRLRRAYELLKGELELLRRRIFIAKAERIDTQQLEIEFAETHAKLQKLATELHLDPDEAASMSDDGEDEAASMSDDGEDDDGGGRSSPPKPKAKSGRRDMRDVDLPEERVEIFDPALEGKVERIGFNVSYQVGFRRGGAVRIARAVAKYKTASDDGGMPIVTAKTPKEIYERGILAPTFIAHLLTKKFRWGMPFHRIALEFESQGFSLDDGTMCRYAEHVGATLGCIVQAMAKEAMATAFCLSTDATGVAIQPVRIAGSKQRQACHKGHFFVVLADKDHVFFEYEPKHTSAAVCAMFKGFKGFIQADAHCIYDALFRGEAVDEGADAPKEIACWSHARRKVWEAAVTLKDPRALEGLLRIRMLFKLEEEWASLPPIKRYKRRQSILRPMLEDFFAWATGVFESVRNVRGPMSAAFGYIIRQRDALQRFLDDGRLRMENNPAERALRPIAVGRKAWLFIGSDDHAQAAANIFSLISSCQLHGLDVESYLAEIIHVLPQWPRDRYIELAPKYWAQTRARLVPSEIAVEIGFVTIPPPLAAEEQGAARPSEQARSP